MKPISAVEDRYPDDHPGIDEMPEQQRDRRRAQQHQHQHVVELGQKAQPGRAPHRGWQQIGAVYEKAFAHGGGGQAGRGGTEGLHGGVGRLGMPDGELRGFLVHN